MNCEQIILATKLINELENIHKDNNGIFYYGGLNTFNIESEKNKSILKEYKHKLLETFKNHNWSNIRKSQKVVNNTLRFIFCKIDNVKSWKGHTIRFDKYTCKKYYLPKSLEFIMN